jgi:hypothetical protein
MDGVGEAQSPAHFCFTVGILAQIEADVHLDFHTNCRDDRAE